MILEGIVTTTNEDGSTNISPMGPAVDDESFTSFLLRPFTTSTTYKNLKRFGHGVLHVTDDVNLMARAAVGRIHPEPAMLAGVPSHRRVLANCCHWFAFDVSKLDGTNDRTEISCQVVETGRVRDFFGFNRAKHAVLEAAILATRLHLLPDDDVRKKLADLQVMVAKTAGRSEEEAFDFLMSYVESHRKQRA